jgi:hypothetical protein
MGSGDELLKVAAQTNSLVLERVRLVKPEPEQVVQARQTAAEAPKTAAAPPSVLEQQPTAEGS